MSDTEALHHSVDAAMSRLDSVWREVGIWGEQRTARCGVVLLHVSNLLEDMVREEEALRDRLVQNVRKFGAELLQLSTELDVAVYKPEDGLSTLQLESRLRSRIETLSKEKEERQERHRYLRSLDQQLCAQMGTVPFSQCSHQSALPSLARLNKYEQHVESLKTERTNRLEELKRLRLEIQSMLEELSLSPNTSFENEVLNNHEGMKLTQDSMKSVRRYHTELKQSTHKTSKYAEQRIGVTDPINDFNIDPQIYHAELISLIGENKQRVAALWEELRGLWARLEVDKQERLTFESNNQGCSQSVIQKLIEEVSRYERLKRQNMNKFIESSRNNLVELWDKCCVESETRQAFKPYFSDDELLDAHDREIKRLEIYYLEHRDLLERVAKRQEMWSQLIDLENRATNPDRYLNRGCSLLKEEKARKKLAAELPKVEQEVSRYIIAWEKGKGRKFLVYGSSFDEYVLRQRNEYVTEKENMKIQKQQQKALQIEEELMYGSRPVTPTCRRYAGPGITPTKTPQSGSKAVWASSQKRLGRLMSVLTPHRGKGSTSNLTSQRFGSSLKKLDARDRSRSRSRTNLAVPLSPTSLPPRHVLREKS